MYRYLFLLFLFFAFFSDVAHSQSFSFFPQTRIENPIEIGLVRVSDELLSYIYWLADDTYFAYMDFQLRQKIASPPILFGQALMLILSNRR